MMLLFRYLCISLLLTIAWLHTAPVAAQQSFPPIVINEFMPNPQSGSEWVELFNPFDSDLDVSGWQLDDSIPGSGYTLINGTVIAAHSLLVIYLTSDILNNSGTDGVMLFNANNELIDSYTYSGTTKGASYARIPDGSGPFYKGGTSDNPNLHTQNMWNTEVVPTPISSNPPSTEPTASPSPTGEEFETPTTEVENTQTPTSTSTSTPTPTPTLVPSNTPTPIHDGIVLSEFMPAPSQGNEWVELYNNNSTVVNLAGWSIDDGPGGGAKITIGANVSVEAHGYIVISLSSNLLNNSGDTVQLINQFNQVIDSYSYTNALNDASYNRDAFGNWYQTFSTSPGMANIPLPTATNTPTPSNTPEPTPTNTATPTRTPSPTRTETPTREPTETRTPSPTRTETPTREPTETREPTHTRTPSPTREPTETRVPTHTRTPSPTREPTQTRTPSPTREPTQTRTPSPTKTILPSDQTTTPHDSSVPVSNNWPDLGVVVLSEFLPQPKEKFSQEWVELFNTGSEAIDLGGWQIDDIEGGGSPYTIPKETLITAKQYLVIYLPHALLNNTNDSVRLIRPDGVVIDQTSYGKTQADRSIERQGDTWVEHVEPSPGEGKILLVPQAAQTFDIVVAEDEGTTLVELSENSAPPETFNANQADYANHAYSVYLSILNTNQDIRASAMAVPTPIVLRYQDENPLVYSHPHEALRYDGVLAPTTEVEQLNTTNFSISNHNKVMLNDAPQNSPNHILFLILAIIFSIVGIFLALGNTRISSLMNHYISRVSSYQTNDSDLA